LLFDFICPGLQGSAKPFGQSAKGLAAREHKQYGPLRGVHHTELISQAQTAKAVRKTASRGKGNAPAADGLSDIFGIELDSSDGTEAALAGKAGTAPKEKTERSGLNSKADPIGKKRSGRRKPRR
jgi:hypothetical protein